MRVILFLMCMRLCLAAEFTDFDCYQAKLTRAELEEKLEHFLKKDENVAGYFELTDEQLRVYNVPPTHSERELEYVLNLAQLKEENPPPRSREKGLLGLRIAIDPGHFGGPFCRLEERYIEIPASSENPNSFQFDEGTLSYLTAVYLKILLEKEGAIVLISRSGIGQGSVPLDFFDWLKQNPQHWSPNATMRQLFKTYNHADLLARAQKINAFQPQLSVIIHFNAHHAPEMHSSTQATTTSNYNMVFIPGAFKGEELLNKESRYEFMRLLVGKDLYHSLDLSKAILNKCTQILGIPAVTATDNVPYLNRVCLKIEEGIYARNLALTRLIHGPICYGETLIQNNKDECSRLSLNDFIIDGKECPSRIKETAQAYFEGIQDYVKNQAFP